MKLIFLRHGETDENKAHRYLGHSDPTLNEHGREQAQLLTARLTNWYENESEGRFEKISAIYSSNLERTRETANIIASPFSLNPCPTSALRELNFGNWELLTYDEILKNEPMLLTAWINNPFSLAPPNGETLNELGARFDTWLEQTLQNTKEEETILIVTHGGPIRWFWSKYLEGNPDLFWKVKGLKHGTGLAVHYDKGKNHFSIIKSIL